MYRHLCMMPFRWHYCKLWSNFWNYNHVVTFDKEQKFPFCVILWHFLVILNKVISWALVKYQVHLTWNNYNCFTLYLVRSLSKIFRNGAMVGAKKLASLAKITPFRSASSSSAALGSSSLIHASTQLKKEFNSTESYFRQSIQ